MVLEVDGRREGTILMILLCQNFQSFNEDGAAFAEIVRRCSKELIVLMSWTNPSQVTQVDEGRCFEGLKVSHGLDDSSEKTKEGCSNVG